MSKGVLLAGGEGRRLHNDIYNKHLSWVYDRLMIEYPLRTLGEMGCKEVVVIGSPKSVPDLVRLIDDGRYYGMDVTYKVQHFPHGTAQALGLARGLVEGVFPVLCGDVYFDPAPEVPTEPTLYWHEFETGNQHTVWNPETNEIIEKPTRDIGSRAIVAYAFDERVFDIIDSIRPSERGELELVDVYKAYLGLGIKMQEYKGFFGDMGTPDGLLRVANHVQKKKKDELLSKHFMKI